MKRHVVVSLLVAAMAIAAAGAAAVAQSGAGQEDARFFVTGFVKSPGSYRFAGQITVAEGIAIAGGFTDRGTASGLRIRRLTDGQSVDIEATLDSAVQPNDTIRVRQRME
ncbi:MAG: SLBB domain-containing protein [Vicinamibacterales bacterium]